MKLRNFAIIGFIFLGLIFFIVLDSQDKTWQGEKISGSVIQTVAENSSEPENASSEFVPAQVISAIDDLKQSPADSGNFYPVVKVIDGDTFSIDKNGEIVFVRLIGVDTPETVHPKKPVECFGKQASEFTKKILANQMVRIETDDTQGQRDKYGRLLAYVYLKDGTFLNKKLISDGFAFEYTYDLPYQFQADFKSAEALARENKLGLWGQDYESKETINPVVTNPIIPAPISSDLECGFNKYNCSDFQTRQSAEEVFFGCGGPQSDIHKLDSDKDGLICESLQ